MVTLSDYSLLKSYQDYYPGGSIMPGRNFSSNSYEYGFNGMRKVDEISGSGNHYTAEFWEYDPRTVRRWNTDPVVKEWESPYATFRGNPIWFVDPNGDDPSTHTDEDGKVITVKNDGDNSVYKHKNGTTAEDIDKSHGAMVLKTPTSAGGEKMGETEHWDEFVDPEKGTAMTKTTIQFGKSFDPIIEKMGKEAKGMDLTDIAAESSPGGKFDIKVPYANTGGLLNGKYATSRSAGNYLAGYNAQGGTLLGGSISFTTFQKLAGVLHSQGSLSNAQKAGVVLFGNSYGPPPAYGEIMYQYRMSKAGWDKAKLNNK